MRCIVETEDVKHQAIYASVLELIAEKKAAKKAAKAAANSGEALIGRRFDEFGNELKSKEEEAQEFDDELR